VLVAVAVPLTTVLTGVVDEVETTVVVGVAVELPGPTGNLPQAKDIKTIDDNSIKKEGLLQNLWVKIRVKSPKYQLG
jgi:hypothetical protein